jgi:hypothetical protein
MLHGIFAAAGVPTVAGLWWHHWFMARVSALLGSCLVALLFLHGMAGAQLLQQ